MHSEAWHFLSLATSAYRQSAVRILDLGARDINGSPRVLFPHARYVGLDLEDGPGVDIVADAATWEPDDEYDVVISAEVFEHTPDWPKILRTAHRALAAGGLVTITAACDPRAEHSAYDGGPLHPGEYYANIVPAALGEHLEPLFAKATVVVHPRGDVYAAGIKCVSC